MRTTDWERLWLGLGIQESPSGAQPHRAQHGLESIPVLVEPDRIRVHRAA
jgi:hypothetical protein